MKNYRLSDILDISGTQRGASSRPIDHRTAATTVRTAYKPPGTSSPPNRDYMTTGIHIPVIIEEQHLLQLLMSQYFFEAENMNRPYLVRKSDDFGHHIDGYLTALCQLPLFAKEKVNYLSSYYKAMTRFIATISEQSIQVVGTANSFIGSRKNHRLINNTPIGVSRFNSSGNLIMAANSSMSRMLGYDSIDELLGISTKQFCRDLKEWDRLLQECERKGFAKSSELVLLKKGGIPVYCSCTAAALSDQNQDCCHIDTVFEDITENRNLLHELRVQSEQDPLTSIFNRNKFLELLAIELETSGRHTQPLALIMLDIDHLDFVNKRRGHAVGDLFLQTTADIIASSIRSTDIFARYGGEEFAIICPQTDMSGALSLAEKIRITIEGHVFPADIAVTISAGVSAFSGSDSETTLIARAVDALHAAKRKGGDRVETNRPSSCNHPLSSDMIPPLPAHSRWDMNCGPDRRRAVQGMKQTGRQY